MSFLSYFRAAAVAAVMAFAASPAFAQSGSLATPYESQAGRAGITLDLTPSSDMTIDSFDINVGDLNVASGGGAGQTAIISVYWRTGSAAGFSGNSSGWTLLGTSSVTSQGTQFPTHLPIGGLTVTAGQTYGLYFDLQNYVPGSFVIRYNSSNVAPVSNADLTIVAGEGKESPVFASGGFSPRLFSGAVYYTKVPTTTCASEGYTGTKLTWCKNICENGLTGATLDMWIHRWVNRYRDLPYCAQEGGGEEEQVPTLK